VTGRIRKLIAEHCLPRRTTTWADETRSKFIESVKTAEAEAVDEADKSPDRTKGCDGAGDETRSRFIRSTKTTEAGEADEAEKCPDRTNSRDRARDKFDRSNGRERASE
jgi:hypothetical protein